MDIKLFREKKQTGRKITMLTAYNYIMGELVDAAGIDIVLVGDSLANVEMGLESTCDITIADMMHHLKAVKRSIKDAFVVVDMPYGSFHISKEDTLRNAKLLVDAGADAVKIEWHENVISNISLLAAEGIEVMGHVGLTPQTAEELGGFKVQGRTEERAQEIVGQALELERTGCFAIVLECVPEMLAKEITDVLSIPTIGIGAGKHCDGQVLVTYDLLGMYNKLRPKFVKQYAQLADKAIEAMKEFKKEVDCGEFPAPEHTFK